MTPLRKLLKERVFFILPEWAGRWHDIFANDLNLSAETARELMAEDCTALVYTDTGLKSVPTAEMDACSDYLGLPWRIEKTDLRPLGDELARQQDKADT